MFGTLRFCLACMVVIYHMSYKPFGILLGASAVTVFYIISGYVISGLYTTRFITMANVRHFYVDRIIRIAPQYYFYLLITFLIFYAPHWSDGSTKDITLLNLIRNFTLVPLGLTLYLPESIKPMETIFPLVDVTWSLANEFIFYLIAPFLFLLPFLTFGVLLISLSVFCLASHNVLSIYQFTYWVLPGPLVFFLIGHFIYQKKWTSLLFSLIVLCINHLSLISEGRIGVFSGVEMMGFNLDIYVGLYVGVISILFLKNFKSNALDNFLGSISYGCFLCNFFLRAAMPALHIRNLFIYTSVLVILSCCLGAFSFYCVEKPIRNYYRQRKERKQDSINGMLQLVK